MEEFGIEVKVMSLSYVIESIDGEPFHRVDIGFLCEYIKQHQNVTLQNDINQIGRAWLDIDHLLDEPLYPSKLSRHIQTLYQDRKSSSYLGNESMEA